MNDPMLLTTTRVRTFAGERLLTEASGFFFERGPSRYLVTNRHVLTDTDKGHTPERIEIEIHSHPADLTRVRTLTLPLYEDGRPCWVQGGDMEGEIDVAVLELDPDCLPDDDCWRCFSPAHLLGTLGEVEIGQSVLVVGFPLGFHDTRHHLPVARQASIASAFGVRFQGHAQFLTDARTHRGSSGSPVVMRNPQGDPKLPWKLLGIHASRYDMNSREPLQDEGLGLNSAWYADILLTLTARAGLQEPWSQQLDLALANHA